MRDFEQRKSEIFRRSEEKIKENRRKRNRLLAACVPAACLCLCIGYLYSGPGQNKAQGEAMNEGLGKEEQSTVAAGDAVQESESRVEVYREDFSGSYSELDRVARIEKIIGGILESEQVSGEDFVAADQENTREAEYKIILTDGAGNASEYILSGAILTDPAVGKEYRISPGELAELREALELPAE